MSRQIIRRRSAEHRRCQGNKYDKRRSGEATLGQIKNRFSIDDRLLVVDHKPRVDHWEIDRVIGKDH